MAWETARNNSVSATGVLATFLGTDPINVGATPDQKAEWLGALSEHGHFYAYGATEPQGGSDLGALATTAVPVEEGGTVVGYRLSGRKQWISNGGVADRYTILANAPGGPSWFLVDKGAEGFTAGKPEDKQGIRASNTAALFLENVYVPADRLIGKVEGRGLAQAQAVFGYTRLMVAAFGLGAGWAALQRAIRYSQQHIAAGGPLSAVGVLCAGCSLWNGCQSRQQCQKNAVWIHGRNALNSGENRAKGKRKEPLLLASFHGRHYPSLRWNR